MKEFKDEEEYKRASEMIIRGEMDGAQCACTSPRMILNEQILLQFGSD